MAPVSKSTPGPVKSTGTPSRRRSQRFTPLRSRSCSKGDLKSSEELELEDMKKYAFRATPVNKKILEKKTLADIPIAKKVIKPTVAKPFKFATEARLSMRKKSDSKDTNSSTTDAKTTAQMKAIARPRANSASAAQKSRGPLTSMNRAKPKTPGK